MMFGQFQSNGAGARYNTGPVPVADLSSSSPLPRDFKDCTTTAQRQQWIASPRGQNIIANRPRIAQAQQSGNLDRMVTNTLWIPALNELFKDQPNMAMIENLLPAEFGRGNRGARGHSTAPHAASQVATPEIPIVPLSSDVKLKLFTDGYAVLPGHIPEEACINALKFINSQLGDKDFVASIESDQQAALSSTISSHPFLLGLCTDLLKGEISELLHGVSAKANPIIPRTAQIALRFPKMDEEPPADGRLTGQRWHIDGMKKGDYAPFSMLIGIALTDQPLPFMGNLCVYPGSHNSLKEPVRKLATAFAAPNFDLGTLDTIRFARQVMGHIDLGEPTQLILRPGDVVLCHQRTAHEGAPNIVGPTIRQMIYFRVAHKDHEYLKEVSLDDTWAEFEGMHELRAFLSS
jgi:hypothetical protein